MQRKGGIKIKPSIREKRKSVKIQYWGKTAKSQNPGRKKKKKVESWGDAKVNC